MSWYQTGLTIPAVYPGERPPSTTSPAILKSEQETLVIGASGGSFITSGFASVRQQQRPPLSRRCVAS